VLKGICPFINELCCSNGLHVYNNYKLLILLDASGRSDIISRLVRYLKGFFENAGHLE
jgi:hypothetical protein